MKGQKLITRYGNGERDFSRTDLSRANLIRADLSGADLDVADLRRANLREAYLSGAIVTDKQLAQAGSLRLATLPDGTKHE